MVTVHSKPACVQCNATYRHLDKLGVEYDVVDMSQDPDAVEKVRELGFVQAPVVISDEDSWSGYVPDKIDALAQ